MAIRKIFSFILILSLFVCAIGVISIDSSYAASKRTKISNKTVSLSVGDKFQQNLLNKKGKAVKSKKVKWKSKNKKVATINKNGKITAKAVGIAKMTARYQGKTFKFTVCVKQTSIYSYSSSNIVALSNYLELANNYTKAAVDDIEKWVYVTCSEPESSADDYLMKYRNNLNTAITWLNWARRITSSKETRDCKSENVKHYGNWDTMVYSMLLEANRLQSIDPSSNSTLSSANDYSKKVQELQRGIELAYSEVIKY